MFGSTEKTPLLPTTERESLTSSQEDRNFLAVPAAVNRLRSQSHQDRGGKNGQARRRSSHNMRTNSVTVSHDFEDSIISTVSTSYGPVVVVENDYPGYGGVIGLILATLSGVLFTVNNFLFQYFELNLTDMFLVRSGLKAAVLGLVLVLTGCSNFLARTPLDWFLIIAQSITSGARVGLTFACLKLLPLGDALTIIFSEPLWTLMLSSVFLRTRVGWWKLMFSLFLITGVVLCTQPPVLFSSNTHHQHRHHHSHHQGHQNYVQEEGLHITKDTNAVVNIASIMNNSVVFTNETNTTAYLSEGLTVPVDDDDSIGYYIGVLLALGAAMCGSASNVIVAKVEEISSTSLCTYRYGSVSPRCGLINLSVSAFSGLGGVLLALVYGTMVDTEDVILTNITMVSAQEWLILLLLSGMGVVGFFALTRSLQLIPPTTVAVVRAMEIVLAYGVQAAVLGEVGIIWSFRSLISC